MADQNINKKKKIVAATYNSFDDLPNDLKINILCRIPVKLLAIFTCVSKAWHYFITHSCFPIALPCSGLLVRQETRTVRQQGDVRFWQFSPGTSIHGFFDSALKFKVTSKEVLDCCNGLTLLCHCTKKATSSQGLYYYYVLNPMTKQCVTVTKPGPKTAHNAYAALAYNPSESSYFKIVRFQGCKKLNIFSSDTGNWSSFGFQLEKSITRAAWMRQCVFHKGAIYRLSMSGHLLRFVVEKEVRVSARAKAIDLPEIARKDPKGCVGLKNGDINFAMSDGLNMRIWALQHNNNSTTHKNEWTLKYTVPLSMIKDSEVGNTSRYQPLAFHPHSDIVFLGGNGWITSYHLSGERLEQDPLQLLFWGLRVLVFPVIQCAVPFASNMLDERSDCPTSPNDIEELVVQLRAEHQRLQECERYMQERERYMQERERYMQECERYVQERERYIQEFERDIQELQRGTQEYQRDMREHQRDMQEMSTRLSNMSTRLKNMTERFLNFRRMFEKQGVGTFTMSRTVGNCMKESDLTGGDLDATQPTGDAQS